MYFILFISILQINLHLRFIHIFFVFNDKKKILLKLNIILKILKICYIN